MPDNTPDNLGKPKGLSEKELEEVNVKMDQIKVDPTLEEKETESLKVHPSDNSQPGE